MAGESQSWSYDANPRRYFTTSNVPCVYESVLTEFQEHHRKGVMKHQAEIEELQYKVDTRKRAVFDAKAQTRFWRDEDLDLKHGPSFSAPKKLTRSQASEFASLQKLVALIPGESYPEENLKNYLLDTLHGYKSKAVKLALAHCEIQLLNNAHKKLEDERDRLVGNLGWCEDIRAYDNKEIVKLEKENKRLKEEIKGLKAD
jgi:hypothetical protein